MNVFFKSGRVLTINSQVTRYNTSPHSFHFPKTYKSVQEGVNCGICGLTWWTKPENPGKIADLGRATTNLSYAYSRVRTQAAVMTSKYLPLRYPDIYQV